MCSSRYKDFEITREHYNELLYFSRQYFDYLKRGPSDPAAWKAAAIHTAAHLAREDLAEYVLENVTTGRAYESIEPPCGRGMFFDARKRYFVELARLIDERPPPEWWSKSASDCGFGREKA